MADILVGRGVRRPAPTLFDLITGPATAAQSALGAMGSAAKGAAQATVGLPGDVESLVRMLTGGEQQLPTTEQVGQFVNQYIRAPYPQYERLGEFTGLPTAARAAQQGIKSATPVINRQYEQIRRPLASPVFNTEVAVTNPALLQNVDLNNAAGIALSRERLNAARQATGSEYANAPMSVSQGAWQGTQGFEANPVFMQELPRSMGRVKDQDYMKYIAQTSENLTQDANAVARFVPFLFNDTIRSNAAIIKNVTPEQLKKLGEAGLTNDMVIAARPGNKALVMGFDDEPGQIPQLIDKIKKIVPGVKFETGISRQDVDRIYMVRNPDEFGTPTYEDFGATSRPSGLLDTLDERLRQESY